MGTKAKLHLPLSVVNSDVCQFPGRPLTNPAPVGQRNFIYFLRQDSRQLLFQLFSAAPQLSKVTTETMKQEPQSCSLILGRDNHPVIRRIPQQTHPGLLVQPEGKGCQLLE